MFLVEVILFCKYERNFLKIRQLFAGKWSGKGFAKFPTIDDTAYTEHLEFVPDRDKDAIYFNQKTWYKNDTDKNDQTVFWDTGFIILKENKIMLNSVQAGGRIEQYLLTDANIETFTFDNTSSLNDDKTARSQRRFTVDENSFHYELNMAFYTINFQNHLSAYLKKIQ